ncbi:MAG: GNAT family N-acetyltransferase [Chitinophagia bacterium]|nr:GNAT family N-acetyltransferase [Chitinophagia bacterium]NCA30501.1 GNAT family N-acetyltransferase [Chitinophagia bacterium]NDD16494.1 GNAT family N-acetyltransferase [Chitinophagia bacterium]
MMEIVVRKIHLVDLSQLQKIGISTFSETFAEHNTKEDLEKYLKESFASEKLSAELANPNASFYFAVLNEEVIGYLKINFGNAQTELKDNKSVEIERIYVLQAYQGKKIGQLLYNKAIEIAREYKASYVWLGVWEENHKALQFYKKNGFVPFDTHIFKLGNDEQTDIMMKKAL